MGEAVRQGPVSGIEIPDKGPAKAKVGGRSVRFWAKEYGKKTDSEVLELLRGAVEQGLLVTVYGEESERSTPEGEPYTQFMAKSVTLGEPVQNGSKASESHGEAQKFVGREPGPNDHWTAYRWALSSAIDILGAEKKVAEYQELAEELFLLSWHRSEFLANPSVEKAQETQNDGW